MSTEQNTTTPTDSAPHTNPADASLLTNWKDRFEDLLKSKNLDELKGELSKLATELQKEIQSFDLNAHLSPATRDRVKSAEKSYNEVVKSLHKVQKQFDKEFSKTLRLVKKTRSDAEKHINQFSKKFGKQKAKIAKVVKRTAKKAGKKTSKSKGTSKTK